MMTAISTGGLGPNDSITISDVDDVLRSFTASVRTLKHLLILHITLPLSYPTHGIPVIQVAKGTTVDAHSKVKINKVNIAINLFYANERIEQIL